MFPTLFRGVLNKPLGVAYATFASADDAKSASDKINGTTFKFRKLRVRAHTPYAPKSRLVRFPSRSGKPEDGQPNGIVAESAERADQGQPEPEEANAKQEKPEKEEKPQQEQQPEEPQDRHKYSEDTVFIKDLKGKVTREKLVEFFQQYNPTNVRIMRQRRFPKGWGSKTNALVTFGFPEGYDLDKVLDECSSLLIDGSPVKMYKAFASRVGSPRLPAEESEQPSEPAVEAESQVESEGKAPGEDEVAASGDGKGTDGA